MQAFVKCTVTLCACLSLSQAAGAEPPPDKPPSPPSGVSSCANVTAVARMEAFGYTHLLVLTNNCAKTVVCKAWTDVDPEPKVTLVAAPKTTAEAITRRGSPAYAVSAQSECAFASK